MRGTLQIADGLTLPLEGVTQTFGILGKRGGGKSYTAKVMAEEMIKANAHVCAVDPIGNWWALRLGADGKSTGMPITVLGGDYGDLPLQANERSGEEIARLIVEENISLVIDLSRFRKGEQAAFMIGWAETLYRLNREALHLFIDEADAWAPQRPVGNLAPRLLGAMEDLVRRGRARGIGVTMITQRSASINKDLLTQIEVLIAKRTIAPQDRDAIEAWVEVHGTPEQQKTLMASLPSLPKEDAWFWSPGWLDLFKRVTIRPLETFDSSATPEVGRKRIKPRQLAPVDLEKLQARMAATIEKAKSEDPVELRKKLAQAERRSAELEHELKNQSAAKSYDTAALEGAEKKGFERGAQSVKQELAKELRAYEKVCRGNLRDAQNALQSAAEHLSKGLEAFDQEKMPAPSMPSLGGIIERTIAERPVTFHATASAVFAGRSAEVAKARPTAQPRSDGNSPLAKGERAVLIACAQYPSGAARNQLLILSGYKRSSCNAYIQRLTQWGYVVVGENSLIVATDEGIKALGDDYEPLPMGLKLQQYWLERLPAGEAAILKILVNSGGPVLIDRNSLDAPTGFKRSSRNAYLQRLAARRLIRVDRGFVAASEELF